MPENKTYQLKKGNLPVTHSFSEEVKGCPVPTNLKIDENGVISIEASIGIASSLAQKVCTYYAQQEGYFYKKAKTSLVNQLFDSYSNADYCLSFYKKVPQLESAQTLDVMSLYNKALRKHQGDIATIEKEKSEVVLKTYTRKHLNAAVAHRGRLEEFLREEAAVILTKFGIFKPSQSVVEEYVRENISELVRKFNLQAEEVSDFFERMEDVRERNMNQQFKQEYDAKIQSLDAKINYLNASAPSEDSFYDKDGKDCEKALQAGLLNDGVVYWPFSFSLKYNYDQKQKSIAFSLTLPTKAKMPLQKKSVELNGKDVEVYKKSDEAIEADYIHSVLGLTVAIAQLTFNAHQYIGKVNISAFDDNNKALYECEIHREAMANIQHLNSLQDVLRNVNVSGLYSEYIPATNKKGKLLGTSANDLQLSSIALDKYLEWVNKQGDVMTMRGVKVLGYDTVQVTDAFLQRRYSGVMSYALQMQTYDGRPQVIKKSELIEMELKRNINTYITKMEEDCEKFIQKANDYEFDKKWAMAIKYYERCVKYGYGKSLPYKRLQELYNLIGDEENALRIVQISKQMGI